MRLRALAACLFLCSIPCALAGSEARAGERPYAFVQGVESLPQGGLELENWFGAIRPQSGGTSWEWWLGPVVGITDQFEAGLFGVFLQPQAQTDSSEFLQLDSIRFQASYALAPKGTWPIDVQLRLEVGVPAADDALTLWGSVFAARDFGRLNLTANLVGSIEVAKTNGAVSPYLSYGLGISYAIVGGFRAGAELYGEEDWDADAPWTILGPTLAYGTGRLWAALSYGFGLTHDSPRERGRIVVGLSF